MYEVEIKVELTEEERKKLIDTFKTKNFLPKGITPQNDFYVEAKESPYGGFDLKRYRDEGGKFIYTEKIWEMIDGQPARRENEHEVSEKEFQSTIARFPQTLKIKKDRDWFNGEYQGRKISITIDSVKFDHSPSMRHFIEGEINIEDKKDVPKTKEFIRDFLKDILNKSEIIEAPGMFAMAFKKL